MTRHEVYVKAGEIIQVMQAWGISLEDTKRIIKDMSVLINTFSLSRWQDHDNIGWPNGGKPDA